MMEARVVEDEMDPPAPPPRKLHGEIRELLELAATFWIASVSWVGMKATDTAVLGHVGTKFLEQVAYSDLWTSSSGVFLTPSVLGILCSQAYGAKNYELVTIWLKVSLFVLSLVALPVGTLWLLTGPGLGLFGVKASMRHYAALYAQILTCCIPARIGFNQISQYFTAQKIMKPQAFAAGFALVMNIIGAVTFALVLNYGFIACPIVTSLVEYCQLFGIIVLAYFFLRNSEALACKPTWLFSFENVLTKKRIRQYINLYFPAALALASDFWRLAAIGAIAASLSRRDLGVFNASYRIMWLSLTIAGSLGTAIQVKLGIRLGAQLSKEAKSGINIGLRLTIFILFILAFIVALIPRQIGKLFSNDEKILHAFENIRFPLAATVFFMNLAVVLERIPLACGRTRLVFIIGFIASWTGQVPAVLLFLTLWQHSLSAIFCGVALGYALLCALLFIIIIYTDFNAFALEAAVRSEITSNLEEDHYTLLENETSHIPPNHVDQPIVPSQTQIPRVQVVSSTNVILDDFDEHDDDSSSLPQNTAMRLQHLTASNKLVDEEQQFNALLSEVDHALARTNRGFSRPSSSSTTNGDPELV